MSEGFSPFGNLKKLSSAATGSPHTTISTARAAGSLAVAPSPAAGPAPPAAPPSGALDSMNLLSGAVPQLPPSPAVSHHSSMNLEAFLATSPTHSRSNSIVSLGPAGAAGAGELTGPSGPGMNLGNGAFGPETGGPITASVRGEVPVAQWDPESAEASILAPPSAFHRAPVTPQEAQQPSQKQHAGDVASVSAAAGAAAGAAPSPAASTATSTSTSVTSSVASTPQRGAGDASTPGVQAFAPPGLGPGSSNASNSSLHAGGGGVGSGGVGGGAGGGTSAGSGGGSSVAGGSPSSDRFRSAVRKYTTIRQVIGAGSQGMIGRAPSVNTAAAAAAAAAAAMVAVSESDAAVSPLPAASRSPSPSTDAAAAPHASMAAGTSNLAHTPAHRSPGQTFGVPLSGSVGLGLGLGGAGGAGGGGVGGGSQHAGSRPNSHDGGSRAGSPALGAMSTSAATATAALAGAGRVSRDAVTPTQPGSLVSAAAAAAAAATAAAGGLPAAPPLTSGSGIAHSTRRRHAYSFASEDGVPANVLQAIAAPPLTPAGSVGSALALAQTPALPTAHSAGAGAATSSATSSATSTPVGGSGPATAEPAVMSPVPLSTFAAPRQQQQSQQGQGSRPSPLFRSSLHRLSPSLGSMSGQPPLPTSEAAAAALALGAGAPPVSHGLPVVERVSLVPMGSGAGGGVGVASSPLFTSSISSASAPGLGGSAIASPSGASSTSTAMSTGGPSASYHRARRSSIGTISSESLEQIMRGAAINPSTAAVPGAAPATPGGPLPGIAEGAASAKQDPTAAAAAPAAAAATAEGFPQPRGSPSPSAGMALVGDVALPSADAAAAAAAPTKGTSAVAPDKLGGVGVTAQSYVQSEAQAAVQAAVTSSTELAWERRLFDYVLLFGPPPAPSLPRSPTHSGDAGPAGDPQSDPVVMDRFPLKDYRE